MQNTASSGRQSYTSKGGIANDRLCNLFDICETPEAPLCPMQESTLRHGNWYPDEPICRSLRFQHLPWIKKQRQIASMRLKDHGFFTIRMLNSMQSIPLNVRGANPDNPNAELEWFTERIRRRRPSLTGRRRVRNADSKAEQPMLALC